VRSSGAGAGQPEGLAVNSPVQTKFLKQNPLLFRFLFKNINFLLKSTQLELRKNTQIVTQKVDTNVQHTKSNLRVLSMFSTWG
jgi:hypothetical protein